MYLVESLVGVCDQQGPLVWVVVVEVGNNLHCHISLPCARGSDHQGQPRLHPRQNGLHLGRSEGNIIPKHTHTHTQSTHSLVHVMVHRLVSILLFGLVKWIGSPVWNAVWLHLQTRPLLHRIFFFLLILQSLPLLANSCCRWKHQSKITSGHMTLVIQHYYSLEGWNSLGVISNITLKSQKWAFELVEPST